MNHFEYDGPEPTIHKTADGKLVHIPDNAGPKLGFVVFALLVFAFGVWTIWDPAARLLFGERAVGRVSEIIRSEPGSPPQVIRYRQPIAEGTDNTRFQYWVTVPDADGEERVLRLGVGSLRSAYANINDEFTVIFSTADDIAYGLLHHRTWAFGVGFLFVGCLLLLVAVPTYLAVGKPIEIDPE
jgi:hypothetical protein